MGEGLNKVLLVGNVGADPELKYTQGGQAVLRLRLATNESYVDKANVRQERTEWHTVIVWGKRGEGLNKVVGKGTSLWVDGRLSTRSWEDKNGAKHYSTEIVANAIGFAGGKSDGAGRGERSEGGGRDPSRRGGGGKHRDDFEGGGRQGGFSEGSAGDWGPGGGFDDDIPFGPVGDVEAAG